MVCLYPQMVVSKSVGHGPSGLDAGYHLTMSTIRGQHGRESRLIYEQRNGTQKKAHARSR